MASGIAAFAIRHSLFGVSLVLALGPARAVSPGQYEVLFGGSGYAPPALVNPFAIAYGDSRTANAGVVSYQSTGFLAEWEFNNGYAGWLFPLSGNRLIAEDSWNYGVGAQSSAGIAGRLTATANDCNAANATTTNPCFTGSHGTLSSSGNIAGASSIVTTATPSGATVAVGDYIGVNTGSWNFLTTVTSISCPSTCTYGVMPSLPTGVSANGLAVFFSHPANSSAFANYIGASGAGATVTDMDNNITSVPAVNYATSTSAAYSAKTDPGQVVFFLGGTNDANLTLTASQPQPLINLAAIFDALGPNGANKIVIAANEVPRGLAEAWSLAAAASNGSPEVNLVGTSPYTYTAHNGANYYDTQQVFYAPCGSTTSGSPAQNYECGTSGSTAFSAGSNDGVQLNNCTTGTTAAANGTAACTPSAGQYSVSGAGVYTFNSADSGKKIAIYYRWGSNAGGAYLTTIHDWLNSATCGSFTDQPSATTYQISGAQCHRPWLHVADTWDQIVDASTGSNYYPIAYASVDGLHPLPYGGALVANAMIATATAAGAIQSAAPVPLPTTIDPYFGGSTSSLTTAATYSSSLCPSIGNANKNYFITSLSPSMSGLSQGAAQALYPAAPIFFNSTAGGISGGLAEIDCWDTTNNQVHLKAVPGQTFSGSTATAALTSIMIQADGTNLFGDTVFNASDTGSYASSNYINTSSAVTGCGTSNANCGTPSTGNTVAKGLPGGGSGNLWALTLDSASQAAVGDGVLGVAYGMESNPFGDGYDAFTVQLQGYWGASGTPQITLSENVIAEFKNGLANGVSSYDTHRATCEVDVSAGPNGRLYGVSGPEIEIADTTAAFNAPGVPSGYSEYGLYTSFGAVAGNGAEVFSDASLLPGAPGVGALASGVLTIDEVTPPTTVPATESNTTLYLIVRGSNANDPVSATVRFRRCWGGKVAQ